MPVKATELMYYSQINNEQADCNAPLLEEYNDLNTVNHNTSLSTMICYILIGFLIITCIVIMIISASLVLAEIMLYTSVIVQVITHDSTNTIDQTLQNTTNFSFT